MIIHLDLDSFFASCERILNPKLKNIPIAVGGRGDPFIFNQKKPANIDVLLKNRGSFVSTIFYNSQNSFEEYFVENKRIRGIVITASYEARAYGIKTGMSIKEALIRCPNLKVLPPNHLFYHECSYKVKQFLQKKIPDIEQYSIDEFFGNLNGWIKDSDTERFLIELREEILKKFNLPVSIGAANSKWIAKMATTAAKPTSGNGVKVLYKEDIDSFIDPKPVESFPGIGNKFSKRLKNYKIETLKSLKESKHLLYRWKKPGIQLYHRVNGDDNEAVKERGDRKSIGISRTFDPIYEREELKRRLIILTRYLAQLILKIEAEPKTIFLGLKYQFGQKSKVYISEDFIFSEFALRKRVVGLFDKIDKYKSLPVIRISISCSNFTKKNSPLSSLFEYKKEIKEQKAWRQAAKIRNKYGIDSIKSAIEMM